LREQFDEARECLQVAGQLVRSLGYAEAEVFMPLFGATVASLAGQPEQAEQLLRTAARACARLGMVGLDAAVSRDLARELLDRGAWQEAGEILGWLPAQAEPGRLAEQLAPSEAADQLGIHARLEAARGNLDLAGQLAARAVAEAARTDSPISRGVAALDQAGVLVLAADPLGARAAVATAVEWFGQKGHLVALRRATALSAALGGEQ
jgi:thioredoxin-like negative regulator of GroEL